MTQRRIVYFAFPRTAELTGGQKMFVEHVCALNEEGFDAVLRLGSDAPLPDWVPANCPTERKSSSDPSEIIVVPDDADNAIAILRRAGVRTTIFCQNHLTTTLWRLPDDTLTSVGDYIACSGTVANALASRIAGATISIVPAFADERVFKATPKSPEIVSSPRKRLAEEGYIRHQFQRRHPLAAQYVWTALQGQPPSTVADAFNRAQVFLSLSRWEGLGMTPLEAMRAGCVVAGFRGIGGVEYATSLNGFWAPDDDVDAAVAQLCAAVDLAHRGGHRYDDVVHEADQTAERYSYAKFRKALVAYWSRTAPDARRRPPTARAATPGASPSGAGRGSP